MQVRSLHEWNLTVAQARVLQEGLRKGISLEDSISLKEFTEFEGWMFFTRVNPVPRTYVRGFGAIPFGEVRNIHPMK